MNKELDKYEKIFLGACMGVGLKRRGDGDPHVCVVILVEDDENWFVSQHGFSSYWTYDVIEQLNQAESWMQENCTPDIANGIRYGWEFK